MTKLAVAKQHWCRQGWGVCQHFPCPKTFTTKKIFKFSVSHFLEVVHIIIPNILAYLYVIQNKKHNIISYFAKWQMPPSALAASSNVLHQQLFLFSFPPASGREASPVHLIHCCAAFCWLNSIQRQCCSDSLVKPAVPIHALPEKSLLAHVSIIQTPSQQELFLLCTPRAKEQLKTLDICQFCYSRWDSPSTVYCFSLLALEMHQGKANPTIIEVLYKKDFIQTEAFGQAFSTKPASLLMNRTEESQLQALHQPIPKATTANGKTPCCAASQGTPLPLGCCRQSKWKQRTTPVYAILTLFPSHKSCGLIPLCYMLRSHQVMQEKSLLLYLKLLLNTQGMYFDSFLWTYCSQSMV